MSSILLGQDQKRHDNTLSRKAVWCDTDKSIAKSWCEKENEAVVEEEKEEEKKGGE